MLIDTVLSPKALSLISLAVQNTVQVILMRFAADQTTYFTSIAVVMDEALKLAVCTAILFVCDFPEKEVSTYHSALEENGMTGSEGSRFSSWWAFVKSEVFGRSSGFLSMGIPAVCYTIQKNLSFYAIAQLSPAVYQILFQSKVLTTAFFSYLIMRKEFSRNQKVSLITLFIGLCFVELSNTSSGHGGSESTGSFIAGSIAALLACLSSGFTAVFIEYAIKKMEPKSYTVWVRNIQLSIFGLIASILAAVLKDREAINVRGVFHGFNGTVWAMIVTASLGGLLVSLVVKYADNILKTFATSVSIIGTAILSTIFFDFKISVMFISGTAIVLFSIYLYSVPAQGVEVKPSTGLVIPPATRFEIYTDSGEHENLSPITHRSTP